MSVRTQDVIVIGTELAVPSLQTGYDRQSPIMTSAIV